MELLFDLLTSFLLLLNIALVLISEIIGRTRSSYIVFPRLAFYEARVTTIREKKEWTTAHHHSTVKIQIVLSTKDWLMGGYSLNVSGG